MLPRLHQLLHHHRLLHQTLASAIHLAVRKQHLQIVLLDTSGLMLKSIQLQAFRGRECTACQHSETADAVAYFRWTPAATRAIARALTATICRCIWGGSHTSGGYGWPCCRERRPSGADTCCRAQQADIDNTQSCGDIYTFWRASSSL